MTPIRLLTCLLLLAVPALPQHKKSSGKKSATQKSAARPADTALAVHQSSLIIDTHADTTQRFLDENFDLAQNTPVSEGNMDFDKIKKGNLGAEFFSIWVEP